MAVKEIAKEVIDSLPDEATLDDIIHALYVRAKFDRGERKSGPRGGLPTRRPGRG